MFNAKEVSDSRNGNSDRCYCGICTQWGCACTSGDGSHDQCLCDRCGDRGDGYDPDYTGDTQGS